MKRYRRTGYVEVLHMVLIATVLVLCVGSVARAQLVASMRNHDMLYLDAFSMGTGTTYADTNFTIQRSSTAGDTPPYLNILVDVDSTICANQLPLIWNNVVFFAAGVLNDTLTGQFGEDSVVRMTLYVNPVYDDTVVKSICDNQSYLFADSSYAFAGTYTRLLSTIKGCDSLCTLVLSVRSTSVEDTTAVACDSIFWHGRNYTAAGIYADSTVGPNSVMCDSTIVLTLMVHPTFDTVDTIIICPYRPYVYGGVDYGGPVTFDTTLYSIYVCDSVVHVTLQPRDSNYHLMPYFRFDSTDWQETDSVLVGCAPTTLYLVDSTEKAEQWLWTLFASDTTFASTEQDFSYSMPKGSDSVMAFVSLIVEDENGCFDTVGWPVFVFPSPEPEFRWEPRVPSIHHPETYLLNISTPLREEMEANHSIAYLWRIQKDESGSFDTSTTYDHFYHWGSEGDNMAGDYIVRLISFWTHYADSFYVSDIPWTDSTLFPQHLYEAFYHVCADTAEHIITITNEYLQFPNLVTPDGDGINDRWEVVNLLEFGNYPMNELWIYDRTGTLIYHVRNIRKASQFWDPVATRSPDGTYYYRFVADGDYGVVKRNGLIEVLRK